MVEPGRDLDDLLANLRPKWMQSANCRGQGTDAFFQERGKIDDSWRSVCAGCAVRGDCLEYAMADASLKGFWAGKSDRDRRRMRAARRAA